jgi:glycolate oxidase
MKASSLLLRRLAKDLPPGELLVDPASLTAHSGDKWHATHLPDAVAKPCSTRSVATIAAYADRHRIPLTPRGAGFGYVGGCVPVQGGIVLSLEKLDRIFEISRKDFIAVVGPGVNTARLQIAAEKKGLFYPPDPASRLDCRSATCT